MPGSSVLVKFDNRPGSVNSGSYATIADLEPLYARPCGSTASYTYYATTNVSNLSEVNYYVSNHILLYFKIIFHVINFLLNILSNEEIDTILVLI